MKKWTKEQRNIAYNNYLKSFLNSKLFWVHCFWGIFGFIPSIIAVIYLKENIFVVIIIIMQAVSMTYFNNYILWNESIENHIYNKWLKENNLEEQNEIKQSKRS